MAINGTDGPETLTGTPGDDEINALGGDDTVNAGDGNDTVNGGLGNDTLNGQVGDDILNGDAGNDFLDGGAGNDAMSGGIGNDTYIVDSLSDTVNEGVNAGTDAVRTALSSYTLGANVENLVGLNVAGQTLAGNGLDNVLQGHNGNDLITGGDGNDTIYAFGGDDVVDAGVGSDLVLGGTGADILSGGTGVDNLQGESGDDVLNGGDANDNLYGGTGNDRLNGDAAQDRLVGGAGNDILDGGAGTDTAVFTGPRSGYSVVHNEDGSITVTDTDLGNGDEGTDTLSNVELLDFAGQVSNANGRDITLTGSHQAAGAGALLVSYVSFTVTTAGSLTIYAGERGTTQNFGTDSQMILFDASGNIVASDDDSGGGPTFQDSLLTLNLPAGDYILALSDYELTASEARSEVNVDDAPAPIPFLVTFLEGTAVISQPVLSAGDTLEGTAGNDNSYGFTGADTIDGLAGDDVLNGGTGDDTLNGGSGRDELYGGAGSDTLNGGDEGDYLDGGAGTDVMAGGPGNDVYRVDNGLDRVIEMVGEGYDRVSVTSTFTLEAGSEVESLSAASAAGTAFINLIGNEFSQRIVGNAGAGNIWGFDGDDELRGLGGDDGLYGGAGSDILDGGTGADVMEGGTGNDVYFVDNAGDIVRENAGEGNDWVYTSTSYALGVSSYVEFLATTDDAGTGAIDLSGSNRHNTIIGNDGANVINGGDGDDFLQGLGGNDVLDGGAGQDIMEGGTGADVFRFEFVSHSTAAASDRIRGFESGVDKIDLSLVDQNLGQSGGTPFHWVGTEAFSGTAGELRYEVVGTTVYVTGDADGDKIADFGITLDNTNIVSQSDFIF